MTQSSRLGRISGKWLDAKLTHVGVQTFIRKREVMLGDEHAFAVTSKRSPE